MKEDTKLSPNYIYIKGAKEHNLKDVSVNIPKNSLVTITGVSGSGKSSLTIDTLFAEGQRRYVESLSSYARQFLMRMDKPDVNQIIGICPAIALEQKTNSSNPRSTVGTSSEIYDYLKLLFARIGKTISPISNKEVKCNTASDVLDFISTFDENQKVQLLAPLNLNNSLEKELNLMLQKGFNRMIVNETAHRIDDLINDPETLSKLNNEEIFISIDRFTVKKENQENDNRIIDSTEIAFFEGHGELFVDLIGVEKQHFSNRFELDGIEFEKPTDHLFSFTSPQGACPQCEGFGTVMGINPDLVIPDKTLSIYDEAVACWKGEKMKIWKDNFIKASQKTDFPIFRSYNELTKDEQDLIWHGNKFFDGINTFFNELEEQSYKIQYRVLLSRYRGKTTCPTCDGNRLKKETSYIKVNNLNITDLINLPLDQLLSTIQSFKLNEFEAKIASRVLKEIIQRVKILTDVGLSYLTLNRDSRTLSGGESQRINLGKFIGSSLINSLYILDEPSIGLHPKDTDNLISVLHQLRNLQNTVIVVEHDEEIMKASDHIIDMGPLAGELGGEVIFEGNYNEILRSDASLTGNYLSNKMSIQIPESRRKWNNYIQISEANKHNLNNITVKFPLNVFTVVSGMSGSGKTTLIKHILYPYLNKLYQSPNMINQAHSNLTGDYRNIKQIELIDQNPIGRSSRSNPVTYVKAYDAIRKLFANQQSSKLKGFKASHFSFNVEGGRCEACKGDGNITVEMQFMADVYLVCEECKGSRFHHTTLEVTYKDKNISDILNMTIDDAMLFFSENKDIIKRISPLQHVGLGYIRLGQSSNTLSGGEAQRVKLASFLIEANNTTPTLFIFDEPTTGLHFHDISKLLKSFDALINKGHSIIVIEHNLDVIKYADWVIDLGPEGGINGGNIVFEGPPEDLIKCKDSITALYLKEKFTK